MKNEGKIGIKNRSLKYSTWNDLNAPIQSLQRKTNLLSGFQYDSFVDSLSNPSWFHWVLSFFRYQEVCSSKYDFKHLENAKARSFTQLIWRDSKKFGIARSFSKKNGLFVATVVALYENPGNVHGAFPRNIEKGRFIQSYCDRLKAMQSKASRKSDIITTANFKTSLAKRNKKLGQAWVDGKC